MPLSQRAQYSDSKGLGLIKLSGVFCLAAVVFGSICMAVVATMGDGEDPPKIFAQMVAVCCGVFVLGLVVGLVGMILYTNRPEPPKPTLASSLRAADSEETEGSDEIQTQVKPSQPEPDKPDAYASEHRRREF